MHSRLARRPDSVILLIAGYFVLAFVVRLLMPHSMRYDESEQVFFAQTMALGYDSQPPLYNWLQTLAIHAFGLTLATIAAVKNLVLFLVYLSYYKLARLVLADKVFAVIATLSLLTIPQLFWEAQRDLTHTVAQLVAINCFLYAVFRTLKAPSTLSYAAIGVALGLGMLTKYNFALLAAAVAVAAWYYPGGRARLLDRRFWLAVAIAGLIFLPHGLWIVHNFDLASDRTLGMMEKGAKSSALANAMRGILKFLQQIVAIAAPTVIVYLLVFGRIFIKGLRLKNERTRFFDILFIVIALLLLVLIVGMQMATIRDRWLLPYLFLLPIYFCLKMEATGARGEDFLRRFIFIPLAMMLIVPSLLLARVSFPNLFRYYEAYNIPYETFLSGALSAEGHRPGLVLTDDWKPAGNLRLQLPDVPVMSTFFYNLVVPYAWSADHPVLLVWLPEQGDNTVPEELKAWIGQHLGQQYAEPAPRYADIRYMRGKPDDTFRFGYAWIYPK